MAQIVVFVFSVTLTLTLTFDLCSIFFVTRIAHGVLEYPVKFNPANRLDVVSNKIEYIVSSNLVLCSY